MRCGGFLHNRSVSTPALVPNEDYKTIFESSPDGIVLVDAGGIIRRANPMAEQLFGFATAELEGMPVDTLIPARLRRAHADHRRQYGDKAAVRPMGIGLELRAVRKSGTEFPVEIALAPMDAGDGVEWTVATVRDTSLRKRLRDFGAGALRASEDERARIARDLHDDTAQRLATILVRLRLVEKELDDEGVLARIDDIRTALQDAAEGVRRIARGLRPPELEDAGLDSALRSHVRMLRDARGMEVELDIDPLDHLLTSDGTLILYRIVQEALHNVIRHAEVLRARVRVGIDGDRIVGEIVDEGQGFSPHELALQGGGLGLLGMQERAAMLGGTVHVESKPGQGTQVTFEMPLEIAREVGRV